MHMGIFFSKNRSSVLLNSLLFSYSKINSFKYVFNNFDWIFTCVLYTAVKQFLNMFRSRLQQVLFKKGVRKICSKAKCNQQIYKNHTSAWVFCHFVAYIFQKPLRTPLGAACAVSRSFGKITSLLFLSFETERLL